MHLDKSQIRNLKGKAHHLKPVVRIGQKGITDAVCSETEAALDAHELIKVQIADDDRDSRKRMAEQLADATGAQLIAGIGKIFTLYRKKG